MTLVQATIIFAINLMDRTNGGLPYDKQIVVEVATAAASTMIRKVNVKRKRFQQHVHVHTRK